MKSEAAPLVLVVDEELSASRTIERVLQSDGYRTTRARTVREALAAVRQELPDLILLDIHLPDGSGFDVCRWLRADAALNQVPIIFVSAESDTLIKVCAFEMGGVDYITKPIAPAEVSARVRTHLRLAQTDRRLEQLQAERVQALVAAQQNLMPRPESLPEARFAVGLRQLLDAGGDFYDVIPVGDQIVDYIVADASGHDLAASYWTAALKALANEYAGPVRRPEEIVHSLNQAFCEFLPSGSFFTLAYARLHHGTGRLSLVTAGCPPPLLVFSDSGAAETVHLQSDVLGAFPDALFAQVKKELKPGDRLYLFSDGAIEGRRGREQGVARLAEVGRQAHRLLLQDAVDEILAQALRNGNRNDDVVLMGVER